METLKVSYIIPHFFSRASVGTTLGTCFAMTLALGSAPGQQTKSRDESIAQHFSAAHKDIERKQTDLAIEEFRAILALDAHNEEALGNLGVLLYFRGDYKGAVTNLREATRLDIGLWKLRALLGLAEGRVDEQAAARQDLASSLPNLQDETLRDQVASALINNYLMTQDLEKAAAVASSVLEPPPRDLDLLVNAYRLYSQLLDKTILTLALGGPDSPQMHRVMARELARHGEEAPSISNYREAIKLEPQLPDLHFELANELYNSPDKDVQAQAEPEFKTALAMNPNDERALLMLGVIAAKRFDWLAAFDYDTRAVKLQPDDPDACIELAKVLSVKDEVAKARDLIEHAVKIDPTNPAGHYRLSRIYRQQGKSEDSERELEAFHKYEKMNNQLRTLFHDMRLNTGSSEKANDASDQ